MGIGHVAVGLGLKRAAPSVNLGWLIFGAFFADFLLGWFVLAGWEHYRYPENFEAAHFMLFTFPWSHGLLPLLAWSLLCAVIWPDRRVGLLIAAAIFSHFLLDGVVHVQGLPIAGPNSPALGLGLWRNLPLELTIEAIMTAAALCLYWQTTKSGRTPWRIAMSIYIVALGAMTIVGQLTAPRQEQTELVIGWIAAPVIFSLIAGVLDRAALPKYYPAFFR